MPTPDQINTSFAQYQATAANALAAMNELYAAGYIVQIHSHEDGSSVTYSVHIIYREGTDQWTMIISPNGHATNWEYVDLSQPV